MNRRDFLTATLALPFAQAVIASSQTPPFSPASASPPAVDLSRLLSCIGEVESQNNDTALSYHNNRVIARGRYQITEDVWFTYTNRPWTKAHIYSFSLEVGRRHINTLAAYDPNPLHIAGCWRYGIEGMKRRPLTNYQIRVHNLYTDPTYRPR